MELLAQVKKKEKISSSVQDKAVSFVTNQINKNSTKEAVIKLGSKMGYSSKEIGEAYDMVKDELNSSSAPTTFKKTSKERVYKKSQTKKKK